MDGLTLVARVKADPAWRSVTIIAVTAAAMKGDEESALCAGYITKPIDTRRFIEQIAAFLPKPA